MKEIPEMAQKIHPGFPYLKIQVYWAVYHELACTLEDLLARRVRILFLDVKASLILAPTVARLMAEYLGESNDWVEQQVIHFQELSKNYSVEHIYA